MPNLSTLPNADFQEAGQPVESSATAEPYPAVRCRTIVTADLPAVEALLAEGFLDRPREWFTRALESLARHIPPAGFPKFGYALECEGLVVGALLVIASVTQAGSSLRLRRNASCWYVREPFRIYAPLLIERGVRRCDATDINISPARHTWPILEAQGFRRFSDGVFVSIPWLKPSRTYSRALTWAAAEFAGWPISVNQAELMAEHEAFGCFSLVCRDADGVAVFVFRERRSRHLPFPGAQVIFCERPKDVSRFARAIGYKLLLRRLTWLALTSNGPVAGLPGFWFPGRAPMYYRGPDKPASSDLLYTEAALFGF